MSNKCGYFDVGHRDRASDLYNLINLYVSVLRKSLTKVSNSFFLRYELNFEKFKERLARILG